MSNFVFVYVSKKCPLSVLHICLNDLFGTNSCHSACVQDVSCLCGSVLLLATRWASKTLLAVLALMGFFFCVDVFMPLAIWWVSKQLITIFALRWPSHLSQYLHWKGPISLSCNLITEYGTDYNTAPDVPLECVQCLCLLQVSGSRK